MSSPISPTRSSAPHTIPPTAIFPAAKFSSPCTSTSRIIAAKPKSTSAIKALSHRRTASDRSPCQCGPSIFVSSFDSLSFVTDNGPQNWLYIAAGILFLLPCLLLCLAWWFSFRSENPTTLATWRNNLLKTALLLAGASTLIHILWNASWLHSGGSPHGMGAGPGIWQSLGTPLLWTFGTAVVLSVFAKGKSRTFLMGWFLSMVFVFYGIYILQME